MSRHQMQEQSYTTLVTNLKYFETTVTKQSRIH